MEATRRRRWQICGALAVAGWVALGGVEPVARATNENRPRTPAGFVPSPCLQDLDRSSTQGFAFEVAIPFEDTATTADELPDSRTFQFVATCRDRVPGETLPNWIDLEDAERAMDVGVIDTLPESENVLSTSDWAACTQFITTKDQRAAISCAQTLDPVAWSALEAPPGAYIVRGYTFEPSKNLWTRRPGVVRVHDGDPAEAGPAAALLNPARDARAYADSPYVVTGCAGGPSGTTARVEWAPTTAKDLGDDAAWTPVATVDLADPVVGETFEVEFDPPPAAFGQAVLFRVTATAPDGAIFRYHTEALLIVLDRDGQSDPPTVGAGPDTCRDGNDTDGGDSGTADDGDGDGVAGGDEACACSTKRRAPTGVFGVLSLLGMMAWARRRGPSPLLSE